ncbi:MAG TPA: hypothetical protein VKY85_28505 [Candidatus Angelobacter sp.]|nr:hypothetical protein [Candidatus Angelobacter sp.]
MDPFAKKMVRGSLVYAGVLMVMFAGLTTAYLHFRPRCSDQVFANQVSPDGRWAAAVLEARCGEDAPFLTHVNLRVGTETIKLGYFSGKADEGEVFLLEQDAQSADVVLNWTAPNRLAISCSHCQTAFLRKRVERWRDVTITYFFDTR